MYQKRKIPEEVRRICYERDEEKCQYMGCELSRPNGDKINLHHIQNEQFGGTEDPSNLITLCDIHHKAMHVEFHAFYPDSEGILRKMNRILWSAVSKIRSTLGVDDAYDLKPYLFYLTRSSEFRSGQLEAIRAAMKGKDVLLVTPTGTGKSVCYQLPGLVSNSPSLVISPLKALMVDQVRSIWSKMIPATYINSDLGDGEKKRRYEFINKRLYKFIFAAPERFFSSNDPSTRSLYTDYSYMVVDEAHAIDSWGIAFRPSYRKLGDLRKKLNNPPVIALTATASRETQSTILQSLGIPGAKVIVTGFYKDNIEIIKYVSQSGSGKYRYLTNLLSSSPDIKTIIFVPTIKEGDALKSQMLEDGIEVEFYNGKLDTKNKMDIQARFTSISDPRLNTLISTSAFGMGIDIPDIRRVVHWCPALSLTEYTQQIGRAGRDGKPAQAHLLYEPRDEGLLRFLSLQSTKHPKFKELHEYSDEDVKNVEEKLNKQVDDMISLTNVQNGTEWNYILDYFGESPLRFWARYGKLIIDVLLICLLGIGVFMVVRLIF
jgi:RecQ family ATP-dependent DNA helicase